MTVTADEPVRPVRPATVSVAFWLQLAAVGVLLAVIGLAVAEAVQFDGQISRAARSVGEADPDEVSGERVGNVMLAVTIGVPALFLAFWFAATARPVRRGGRAARTLLYVGAGLELLLFVGQCCVGALFAPFAFGGEGDWTETENGDLVWEESEFAEALYGSPELSSQLLTAGTVGGTLLVFALTLAVVLLVTLPPADRYFSPRTDPPPAGPQPVWPYPVGPVPPPYGVPGGHPVALPPYGDVPGGHPAPPPPYGGMPSGYPVPPVYTLPPGYLLCPDPTRHLPPPPSTPGPTPAVDPSAGDPTPGSATPGS